MITLDQVQLLEHKVESAISRISKLNDEKVALEERCAKLESINNELREHLSTFEQDQGKIEQGILNALEKLSNVENTILNSSFEQHIQTVPSPTKQIPVQQSVTQTTIKPLQANVQQQKQVIAPVNQTIVQSSDNQFSAIEESVIPSFTEPVTKVTLEQPTDNQAHNIQDTQSQESLITESTPSNESISDDVSPEAEIPSEQDLFSELTFSEQNTSIQKKSSEGEFIY